MKNILLAVVGLSPQVITETLFALHQQGRSMDAVHIITTRQGKEAINAQLLSPKDGFYYRYLAEYGINRSSIDFGFQNVHAVEDSLGREIEDIADEDENEQLLKKCLDMTYSLTSDPTSTVYFSIAGGRKTMSACLMVAAQLYGRLQDRIYHVLVSPEFENSRDFYYPPKDSIPLELKNRNGQKYIKETRYAAVTLAPIPFISVRESILDDRKQPKEPAVLMQSLIKDEAYALTVDLTAGKLIYKRKERTMTPARLALYAFFAMNKTQCPNPHLHCKDCCDCYLDFQGISGKQDLINNLYGKTTGGRALERISGDGIRRLDAENFNAIKSKIRKDLESAFGLYALPELAIEGIGRKPDRRYGVRIDRGKIRLVI